MTRPSHRALLLVLGLACATFDLAASAAGSRDDAQERALRQDDELKQDLNAAAEQAISGDTLGAAIAYERLLADPRMDHVELRVRSAAWLMGAHVASRQGDEALALRRLDTALQVDPRNAAARLTLGQHQIFRDQLDTGVDHLIQGIADSDGAPELEAPFVWQLDKRLGATPNKRLAVLQGLFDKGWTVDGVEPVELWVILATLQVETGKGDVAATLERIDAPHALISLRSDKRFDRYLKRDDPRFDPVAASRRHIDALRLESILSPGINQPAVSLSHALLVAGDLDDVVGMTQPLAEIASQLEDGPGGEGRHVAWMLDHRAIALRRLGRLDEAVEVELEARYDQLRARADVQAAVREVGRIEDYPLFGQ